LHTSASEPLFVAVLVLGKKGIPSHFKCFWTSIITKVCGTLPSTCYANASEYFSPHAINSCDDLHQEAPIL
jgi:hypothetical protein